MSGGKITKKTIKTIVLRLEEYDFLKNIFSGISDEPEETPTKTPQQRTPSKRVKKSASTIEIDPEADADGDAQTDEIYDEEDSPVKRPSKSSKMQISEITTID